MCGELVCSQNAREGGAHRALVASDLMEERAFHCRALLCRAACGLPAPSSTPARSARSQLVAHTGQTSGTRRGRLISLAQKLTVLQARHKRKKPQRRDRVPPLSTYSSSSTSNAHSKAAKLGELARRVRREDFHGIVRVESDRRREEPGWPTTLPSVFPSCFLVSVGFPLFFLDISFGVSKLFLTFCWFFLVVLRDFLRCF